MPLEHHIEIGGGIMMTWSLTEDAEFKKWALKYRYYPTFMQLKSNRRKKEWIARQRLLHEVGLDSSKIYYNEEGKPFVNHLNYKFISISHSKNSVGIFLHPDKNIGLDIESKDRNFLGIVDKYLLIPEEHQAAQQVPDGYALFWCIKEAIYKLIGKPMEEFNLYRDIHISEAEGKALVNVVGYPDSHFELHRMDFGQQIILCVVEHPKNA
ncbi:MAG: 4'-phosphopantetheinyl transferase family protein [Mangrovibacterium sp.]